MRKWLKIVVFCETLKKSGWLVKKEEKVESIRKKKYNEN